MRMFMMDTAWVSSVEHLERFRTLPWYKWLGVVPAGFPSIRTGLMNFPLVYFARGLFKLENDELHFYAATPLPEFMKTYSDLNDGLQLQISSNQITSVERYHMNQAALSIYNLPFIRVKSANALLPDFLICSGADNLYAIRTYTEDLWLAMLDFRDQKLRQA